MMLRSRAVQGVTAVFIAALSMAALHSDSIADANREERTRWGIMRVQGIVITPLGDNRIEGWNDCGSESLDFLSFSSLISTKTTGGVCAGFEYVFARKYGLELCLAYWSEVVGLHFEASDITVDGSPNFIMPTLGANYHFLTDRTKDAYAGALCCLGVIATGFYTDIEISKDVALGLNLGMDYYVKKSWSLGGSLKYIDFGELDFSVLPPGVSGFVCDNGLFGIGHLNFISLTVGIGYRF